MTQNIHGVGRQAGRLLAFWSGPKHTWGAWVPQPSRGDIKAIPPIPLLAHLHTGLGFSSPWSECRPPAVRLLWQARGRERLITTFGKAVLPEGKVSRENHEDQRERQLPKEGRSPFLHEQREWLSSWQTVIEKSASFRKLRTGSGGAEATTARPGRVLKLLRTLGCPLGTSLPAKVGRLSQARQGLCVWLEGQFPTGQPSPHSPNVWVFLATHYTQVFFNHQVVVSRGFRSPRRFKL